MSIPPEGFYVFLAVCWFLVICRCGTKCCQEAQESATQTELSVNHGQPEESSDGLSPEERKEQARQDRRLKILTTLLHKKAIAKPDEKEVCLPHEKILSDRSNHSLMMDEESALEPQKNDIFVDKFNSWRSSRRQLSESHLQHETLYSPKTCAICLGYYKVNEDICWSPNENCHHAFHLDCMIEWLMDNNKCPLCRENYLESRVKT